MQEISDTEVNYANNFFDANHLNGSNDSEPIFTTSNNDVDSDGRNCINLSPDWQIAVSEPEIRGDSITHYMVYTITVKTSNPNFKSTEFSVTRRYSDFEWLRNRLSSVFRGLVIPPLPEKAIINRFGKDFVTHRRKELERFLKRVVSSPNFLQNEDLQVFLEGSEVELTIAKTNKPDSKNSKGLLNAMIDGVKTVKAAIEKPNEVDDWFDQQRKYWLSLDNQYSLLLTRSHSLAKRSNDLSQIWIEFAAITNAVAAEENINDRMLCDLFKNLSSVTNQLGLLEREFSNNQTDLFVDTLKDWIRVIGSVAQLLENRSQDLVLFQNAVKTRELKQERSQKSPTSAQAQLALNQAEARENSCRNKFELISKSSREDIEKLIELKKTEITSAVKRLVQSSMDFHLNAASLWKEVLSSTQD